MFDNTIKWAILTVNKPGKNLDNMSAQYRIETEEEDDYIYTYNPIVTLHKLLPWEIEIEGDRFDPNILVLYINCLLADGYYIDYKKSMSVYNKDQDDEEKSVFGGTLYFAIDDQYMGKMVDELKRKHALMHAIRKEKEEEYPIDQK